MKKGQVNDMERIKALDRYQKGILIALLAMAVIFAAVYPAVISREGYLYNEQLLEPGTENGNTVYQTEVKGELWRFTVTAEPAVTFQCGQKTYGPYTARTDSSAIPKDHDLARFMTGIEVCDGDEILFRGGILSVGAYGETGNWVMYHEDGTFVGFPAIAISSTGQVLYPDGYDPMEPTVTDILRLLQGPPLTHRGDGYAWLGAFLVSVVCAVSLLFADEFFRFHLVFRVRDVELVEPSDWEIACRYIGWTLLTLMAFAVYMMGLRQ